MIEDNMNKKELNLCKYASNSNDAIRIKEQVKDIRPNYFRDIDKIIYSFSYSRYMDKTQVFSFKENDSITKRMVHVQLVSKIGRTIGRALNLNEDLIEAIGLGHDIGHVPFGHMGESILNEISKQHLNEVFLHNVQSVRQLMILEKNGEGLNLSIQVLDGILCHNGEEIKQQYNYKNKTKQEFIDEYEKSYKSIQNSSALIPMTLEGAVVRISDVIGYLGKDIEDAYELGILKEESIPLEIKQELGTHNNSIIDSFVNDVISNSINKPYIKLSDKYYKLINKLKDFNYENIYYKSYTKEEKEQIKYMFNVVFQENIKYLNENNINSKIYKNYLNKMNSNYKNNALKERIVIDYIAGMTDDYFIREFNQIKSCLK